MSGTFSSVFLFIPPFSGSHFFTSIPDPDLELLPRGLGAFCRGVEFCPGFWPPHSPAHYTERQRCCWDGLSAGHTASSPRQTFGVPWSVRTAPSGCTWEGHNDHQLTQKGMGISRSSWALSKPKGLIAPPSPSFYYALPSSTMLSFEKGSRSPTPFTGEKSHTWVTPSWPAYFLSIHSLWHPSPSPLSFSRPHFSPIYVYSTWDILLPLFIQFCLGFHAFLPIRFSLDLRTSSALLYGEMTPDDVWRLREA